MFAYGRDEQAAPLRSYEECVSSIRAGTFRPDQSRSGMVIVSDSAIPLNPSDSSFEALNSAPAPRPQATECLDEDGHQEDGAAGESAANSFEDESSSGSDSSGEISGDEVVGQAVQGGAKATCRLSRSRGVAEHQNEIPARPC